MATLLYRLGRAASRHRLVMITAWLVLLAGVIGGMFALGGETDDEFRIPGTESQRAMDVLKDRFPAAGGISAQVVFTAPAGATVTDPPIAAAIMRAVAEAGNAPQVVAVVDPYNGQIISPDRRVAIAQVRYQGQRGDLREGTLDALKASVTSVRAAGVDVVVGGYAFGPTKVTVGPKELIGVVAALIVLLVAFNSLLAAGLTLIPALLGVAVGIAGMLSMTDLIKLSSSTPTLALMIGLAVGIDYSLLILSRHRSQLAAGTEVDESIGRATGMAGSAVVFAGLTVMIAMAGLSVVRIPFLTVMGLAASLTVAVAVVIAVTLLPALMGVAGERLRPRPDSHAARMERAHQNGDEPANGSPNDSPNAMPFGQRWARIVIARPAATIAVVVLGLGAVAVPSLDLRLALPDNDTAPPESSQRQAYDKIEKYFGPGFNGPLVVLIQPRGARTAPELQQIAVRVSAAINTLPNVVAISAPQLNPAADTAIVQVIPGSAPTDKATKDLVHAIRKQAPTLGADAGSRIAVTGTTAASIDVSTRLGDALLPFSCVVVGLALILLLLVFRSIIVPVKAAIGFLLTVTVAFGVVVAIFQWGWLDALFGVHTHGPVVSFLPIIVIAVLFGLAMDYEVFLISRVREDYVHSGAAELSIVTGFRHAARVVTAAALIMFSVFASFVTNEDAFVKPMAVALAVGVLVDAFVVRMTLVPAVLALVGRGAWWLPRWLDRVLPSVDIEGARLAGMAPVPVAEHHSSPAGGAVGDRADREPVLSAPIGDPNGGT